MLALLTAKAALGEPYKSDVGPFAVDSYTLDLHDAARDRDVPVRVYLPIGAEGKRPVVLVSHGLGGTREGLSYIGKHWASYGYVCVHMQHLGSDDSVWKGLKPREIMTAMRKAAQDPANATNRAYDTKFVLDKLDGMNADEQSKLHAMLDLEKVGIAGHSFGAWTALAAGGMTIGGPKPQQVNDARVRCMIPLSPPVVAFERYRKQSYESLSIPALMMTGTLDVSPINDTTAEERVIPYELMPGVSAKGQPKYLVNFSGADHMTFSGETGSRMRKREVAPDLDKQFHSLILQSTTAFLDTYLLGDEKAKNWLNDGDFVKQVGEQGEVQMDVR